MVNEVTADKKTETGIDDASISESGLPVPTYTEIVSLQTLQVQGSRKVQRQCMVHHPSDTCTDETLLRIDCW